MKQTLNLLTITFVFLFGTIFLNAQTNLNGRYSYKSDKDSDALSFYLSFERQDSVYYSYFYEGAGTIGGKWTLENGLIKVVLTRGNENWTIKFRQKGENLEIAEQLPEKGLSDIPDFKMVLPTGTVFSRIVDKPTGPDLTPQEIGKRVLKLVKSIRTLDDFSPQNIKRQTGIEVDFNAKDKNRYGFGGDVIGASDWFYNLEVFPFNRKDKPDEIRFSFDYQLHEPSNPDTAIISKAIDFDVFTKELQQVGFSNLKIDYGRQYPKPGYITGWSLTRGNVEVSISVKGGWEPKVDKCVTGIDISFLK